jgi:hypothetical protein
VVSDKIIDLTKLADADSAVCNNKYIYKVMTMTFTDHWSMLKIW